MDCVPGLTSLKKPKCFSSRLRKVDVSCGMHGNFPEVSLGWDACECPAVVFEDSWSFFDRFSVFCCWFSKLFIGEACSISWFLFAVHDLERVDSCGGGIVLGCSSWWEFSLLFETSKCRVSWFKWKEDVGSWGWDLHGLLILQIPNNKQFFWAWNCELSGELPNLSMWVLECSLYIAWPIQRALFEHNSQQLIKDVVEYITAFHMDEGTRLYWILTVTIEYSMYQVDSLKILYNLSSILGHNKVKVWMKDYTRLTTFLSNLHPHY